MAPNPQCTAVNSAMKNSGLTYSAVASKIGQSEQHVIDVCTGKVTPTQTEFNALASALGIKDAPHDSAHKTV